MVTLWKVGKSLLAFRQQVREEMAATNQSSHVFLCFSLFLAGGEGSAETGLKETSTCDICQFGAECDVDAEDVWLVFPTETLASTIFKASELMSVHSPQESVLLLEKWPQLNQTCTQWSPNGSSPKPWSRSQFVQYSQPQENLTHYRFTGDGESDEVHHWCCQSLVTQIMLFSS